jgi:hypothetical protein
VVPVSAWGVSGLSGTMSVESGVEYNVWVMGGVLLNVEYVNGGRIALFVTVPTR